MKKIIIVILLIFLMVGSLGGARARAGTEIVPLVYGATSVLAKPGATFSVPIYIKNVTDAYALGFDMNFDPEVVQLTSVVKGTFMGSSNTVFNYGSNISGKVLIGISKYGKNVVGIQGDGLLFTLNFKAIAIGSTKVDFSYCQLYDSTLENKETDCAFSPVEITVSTSSKIRKSGELATLVLTIGRSTMAVDGKNGYKVGSSPLVSKNVTYVPIRAIIEELGGTVEWVAATKTVVVVLNGKEISMAINKSVAYIDGIPVVIDAVLATTCPKIFFGTTMVPLRFTAENLGIKVLWDAKLKTITLTYIVP